jgi:hypothetical protein
VERIIPATEELQKRREFCQCMAELRACQEQRSGPFPTAEEMIREDRDR